MRNFILLVLIFLFASSLHAQWEQAGPTGGVVFALQYVGDDIWAGTSDGLFISVDDGENWERSTEFPQHRAFEEITTIGDDLYLVSSDRVDVSMTIEQEDVFIHRSSDGGLTFTTTIVEVIVNDLYRVYDSRALKLYDLGGRLFLSYWNNGYTSDDDGVTWSPYLTPPDGVRDMQSPFVVLDTNLLYLDRWGALFSSLDTGTTWEQIPRRGGNSIVHISSDTLFRSVGSSPVLFSTDLGLNWTTTNHAGGGHQQFGFRVFEDARGYRLMGYPTATIFSGIDTIGVQLDLDGLVKIYSFLVTKKGSVLIGSVYGLYQYDQGQSTPVQVNSFLKAGHFQYLDISPVGNLYRFSNYTLHKSSNQGGTWTELWKDDRLWPGREPFMIWESETTDTFSIIYGTQTSVSTTNGGLTFDSLFFESPGKYLVKDIDGGKELYCHERDSIWHSNDLGNTWENVGPFPEIQGRNYLDGVLIGKHFDIVSSQDEVFLTRDEGRNWETTSISSIRSPNVGIYRTARLFSFPEGELITGSNGNWFLSIDTGYTWTSFQPNGFIADVDVENMFLIDGTYYAHVPLNGFFRSENIEGPWVKFDENLGSKRSRIATKSHDDILYLYTVNSSLWRYSFETSAIDEYSDESFPLSLKLFPNPSSDLMTVALDQPFSGIVDVAIVDVLGRTQSRQNMTISSGRGQLDLSHLIPGNYQLQVLVDGQVYSAQVSVIR